MENKRSRAINWDDKEKFLLFSCMEEHMHIIEKKCVDSNTNLKKKQAWEKILSRFNKLNDKERTLQQLMSQWKNYKLGAKKRIGNYRLQSFGSECNLKPPSPSSVDMKVISMLPIEFPVDSDEITASQQASFHPETVYLEDSINFPSTSTIGGEEEEEGNERMNRELVISMKKEEHILKMQILKKTLEIAEKNLETAEVGFQCKAMEMNYWKKMIEQLRKKSDNS